MKRNIPIVVTGILLWAAVFTAGAQENRGFSYKTEDLEAGWSPRAAVIKLTGSGAAITGGGAVVTGSTVTIRQAGDYIIEGTLNEGRIVVDAGKKDLVRLVLRGVNITWSQGSPLSCVQAAKTVLILPEGTVNTLTDGVTYTFPPGEDEPDAAIFAKDDLTITGKGSLRVNGRYRNGIASKDVLVITGGILTVNAVHDGIRGKDALAIREGTIEVTAGNDGIKANEDKDPEKGFLVLDGGDITVNAGDDGIHAETFLTINGGTIRIPRCYEGIEGAQIEINGGNLSITSTDDAINAAGGTGGAEQGRFRGGGGGGNYSLRIRGGTIEAAAGGDAIDANGNIYLEGGSLSLSGPSLGMQGAVDFDGVFVITGGRLITAGSALPPSQDSTQACLLVSWNSPVAAGSVISLQDRNGKTLLGYQSRVLCTASAFSSPELKAGQAYTLLVDGQKRGTLTLGGLLTMAAEDGGAYSQGRGGRGGRGPGWGPPSGMTPPGGFPPGPPSGGLPPGSPSPIRGPRTQGLPGGRQAN